MRLPRPFRRTPDPRAEILAEALALYEDGLELTAILALYPEEDCEWLRPLLSTGQILAQAYEEEAASFYFEGSLKAKVLAAGEPVIGGSAPAPGPRLGQLGAALASVAVLVVAGALGVISFGFITAGDSVPGEWNYAFKRATEQTQSRFARGDERINVHIRQAQERIDEIQTLVARGDLNQGHISSFTDQLDDLRELAEEETFDPLQQAKVRGLSETAVAVLSDTEEEIAPAAEDAIDRAYQVAAAVSGGEPPVALAEPEPVASPESEPQASPEPEPEPSASPEPAIPEPDEGGGTVELDLEGGPQPLVTPVPDPSPAATEEPEDSPELDEGGGTVELDGGGDPQPLAVPDPPASATEGGDADGDSEPEAEAPEEAS